MSSVRKTFIDCACQSEGLLIEFYPEDKEVNLGMYYIGQGDRKLTLFERFRWCWRILRTGWAYKDSLIFFKEQTDRLTSVLQEIQKEMP